MKTKKIYDYKIFSFLLALVLFSSFLPIYAGAIEAKDDESSHQVVFDPDDGIAQYPDFHKVRVTDEDILSQSDCPAPPVRFGYIFTGWYGWKDANDKAVLWDFENNKITENTTLWASWAPEYVTVTFDPDDGVTEYPDFHKEQVAYGGLVPKSSIPQPPVRSGYIFTGWYGWLDANGKAVLWDFENNRITENTTLWASWVPEYVTVVFDPDDGTTEYPDFHKVNVPYGQGLSQSNCPTPPVRSGYIFKGWYGWLDENGKAVLWDFENNKVTDNTTLWALWGKKSDGGTWNSGSSDNNTSDQGTASTDGDEKNPNTGAVDGSFSIMMLALLAAPAGLALAVATQKRKRQS